MAQPKEVYRERLGALRALMAREGLDAYYVVSGDYHASEYVGDYFKCREYLSGFDGSAGEMVVTADGAYLWTDGRYFLQAEEQLAGTGIELMKLREPGVKAPSEFLAEHLKAGDTLGFDGRTVSCAALEEIEEKLRGSGKECIREERSELEAELYPEALENAERRVRDTGLVTIRLDADLISELWTDRPALSAESVWLLGAEWTGETRAERLAAVREDLRGKGCGGHLISALDEIAWLFQIRGGDVAYTPVVLSYALLTEREAILYLNPKVLSGEVRAALEADGVEIRPYEQIYADVRNLTPDKLILTDSDGDVSLNAGIKSDSDTDVTLGTGLYGKLLLDKSKVNLALYSAVPGSVEILGEPGPICARKARKTAAEAANERAAHIRDGVAVTKLLYYIKTQLQGSEELASGMVTELDLAERLLALRKEQENFLDQSFEPIIATGAHGAIVHYEPTAETNAAIENNTFLLMDTGGQYLEGTTDITRTVLLGEGTRRMKELYTAVLRGNLNLAAAVFRRGATGANLDVLARTPLWELGLDYNHGTGHGVGYLLNVHEGPQSIRMRNAEDSIGAALEPGMVTSDEPGVYLAGEYGIRLENLMLCAERQKTDFGEFYGFETLTMVPFDRDAILPEQMTGRELELLNAYHARVREVLSPYLCREEREWLREATAELIHP